MDDDAIRTDKIRLSEREKKYDMLGLLSWGIWCVEQPKRSYANIDEFIYACQRNAKYIIDLETGDIPPDLQTSSYSKPPKKRRKRAPR